MKMKFKFQFAILATLIFIFASMPNPNEGKADVPAKLLLNFCSIGDPAHTSFAYCVGYVTGFMANVSITSNRKERTIEPDFNLYFDLMRPCMPPGTQVGDVVKLVVKYFNKWKSKLDRPASLVLMEALHRRYPCDNGI